MTKFEYRMLGAFLLDEAALLRAVDDVPNRTARILLSKLSDICNLMANEIPEDKST